MPGPWVYFGDNEDYYNSLNLKKGDYLEATLYDELHGEEGKGLWRVHKQEEKKSHGTWLQANLIACSDGHLQWWMLEGPGSKQKGQFLLHLCTVAEGRCNKTKRRKQCEFHSDG